jgi:hypothetical protein
VARPVLLDDFLAFSSVVTGYPRVRLLGTGQADTYLSTVMGVVGDATVMDLLATFVRIREAAGGHDETLEDLLRAEILSDDRFGPIARNIIKLWFVGTWYQLPPEWREAYGAHERDITFVASPTAYTEGLLWPTIDANPSGAKGPGYGTWALPPRIDIS